MRTMTMIAALLMWMAGTCFGAPMFRRDPAPDLAPVATAAPPKPQAQRPKPNPKPAKPQQAARPVRKLRIVARAYALRGYTATGSYVSHGTIAVDPRVIPLGTRIYVPGYGWGRAADTGGAIIGNSIDLWMPTTGACYQWGVRYVTISVEMPYPRPQLASRAKRPRKH